MTDAAMTHREQQKEETRQLILATAQALFARAGFERTTMRGIARAAGVAVGTIFVHFPDKSALLAAALYDAIAREAAAALATVPAGVSIMDKLLHLAAHMYAFYAEDPALSRMLLKETLFLTGEWGAAHSDQAAAFMADVATLIAADQAAGLLPATVDPAGLAASFFAHYLFILIDGLRRPEFIVAEQIGRLRLLLAPIRNA